MSERTFEIWKARRVERMRMGQAVYEIAEILSDPEIRLALVPITDADYMNSLEQAASTGITIENAHGILLRDRIQQNIVIAAAAREIDDRDKKFFQSYKEVAELETQDINHIWDIYSEMVNNTSPALDGIAPEELEILKKALQTMQWNELSGQQWYAAKRFLMAISPTPLLDRSPGSSSTSGLTTTKSERKPANDADTSGTKTTVTSAVK